MSLNKFNKASANSESLSSKVLFLWLLSFNNHNIINHFAIIQQNASISFLNKFVQKLHFLHSILVTSVYDQRVRSYARLSLYQYIFYQTFKLEIIQSYANLKFSFTFHTNICETGTHVNYIPMGRKIYYFAYRVSVDFFLNVSPSLFF